MNEKEFKEYLQKTKIEDFWKPTEEFAQDLFVWGGYLWGGDYRIRMPFLKPYTFAPILIYQFTKSTPYPIVSDGGDTYHTLKEIKKFTSKEKEKLKQIVEAFQCVYNEQEHLDRIDIELPVGDLPLAVQTMRLGNVLLMIYGKFIDRMLADNLEVEMDWEETLNKARYESGY